MTLNAHYQKIHYLEDLRHLLSTLYGVEDEQSDTYKAHKNHLDGFVHAGLHIKLVTKNELQKIVESEHLKVYGKTRNQRSAERQLPGDPLEVDWASYDKPAIERNKSRN